MASLLSSAFGQAQDVQQDPEEAKLDQNYKLNSQWAKPPPYQTQLSPADELDFRQWVVKNKIPFDLTWPSDQSKQDYDMRGYYQAMNAGDPSAQQSSNGHFPDTWKTPYHESFSNQSKYATDDAPRWKGTILIGAQGQRLFDAQQHR